MKRNQPDFVLVDLYSQLEAVNAYTLNWERPRTVLWMEAFGEVLKPVEVEGHADMMFFRSFCGLAAGFYFNEENEIIIPGRRKR